MSLLALGPISYGVIKCFQGRTCTLKEAVSYAWDRFGPLFGICLITILCLRIGESLDSIFVGIAGTIVACFLSVAVPVCLFERLGAIPSLKRSLELTKGNWKGVLGLYIVGVLIYSVVSNILFIIITLSISAGSFESYAAYYHAIIFEMEDELPLLPITKANLFFVVVRSTVSTIFFGIMASIIYCNLRGKNDGLTNQELAATIFGEPAKSSPTILEQASEPPKPEVAVSPKVEGETPSPKVDKNTPCPNCGGTNWSEPEKVMGFSWTGAIVGLVIFSALGCGLFFFIYYAYIDRTISIGVPRLELSSARDSAKRVLCFVLGLLVLLGTFVFATDFTEKKCLNCGKVVRQ